MKEKIILVVINLVLLFLVIRSCSNSSPQKTVSVRRKFPNASYQNTEDYFGRQLQPGIIKKTKQIVSNIQAISRHKWKKVFLYRQEKQVMDLFNREKIARYFGFYDEHEEGWLLGIFLQAAARVRHRLTKDFYLPDSFLISCANNEGRVFKEYSDYGSAEDISGFGNIGLDWFGKEFPHLVKDGILYPEFKVKFTITHNVNEIGEKVISANFENVDTAFEAFTATMAMRQKYLILHLKQMGISFSGLPPMERLFWTYYYYNAGQGFGKKVLNRLKSQSNMNKFFTERKREKSARENTFVVLAGMHWMDISGIFDMKPEGKYWWSSGLFN